MSKPGQQKYESEKTHPSASGKRAYTKPVLRDYGSVAKLTAAGSQAPDADASTGMAVVMPTGG